MSAATCGFAACPEYRPAHPGYARLAAVAQRAKAEAVARLYEMMTDRAGITVASDATPSISINTFGSGKAWTTQVVRAG